MTPENQLQAAISSAAQVSYNKGLIQDIFKHDPYKQYMPTGVPTLQELYDYKRKVEAEIDRLEMHTPKVGPTGIELRENDALRNAWESYVEIRKLIGLK